VILCSHAGRPKGKVNESMRLTPAAKRLSELLGQNVVMCDDCIGDSVTAAIAGLANGQVAMLENLRFHAEEEKNDPEFAKQLAANADLYVNDAFGTAHRAHASTEGVTHYLSPCVAGYLIEKELKFLQSTIDNPQRPLAAIIGGSKVSSKIGVIETLLEKCDKLIIGGGMIFTFYKARGLSVGNSLVEEDKLELAKSLEAKAKEKGVDFLLPTDVVLADKFDKDC
jgi:phosphoglycerate kinase